MTLRAGYLVQIFLPLHDNDAKAFPADNYIQIRRELTREFGGLTAFTRAPAEGVWKDSRNAVSKDDIVVFEVMLTQLDEKWWRTYKGLLEKMFFQEEILIRVQDISLV